jgi:lipopolysaccharide biosynthesis glycosyltransferase
MSSTPDPSPIVVACAADARYALPLAVMLNSVGSHAAADVTIDAYILDDGVTARDRRRVAASLPENIHLEWRRPVSALRGLPTWGRMSLTTYQKLTLDEWLPDKLDRAIWLDCDLLVLEDLSRLWRRGMGSSAVLAVQDQRVPVVSASFGVSAWRELGLPAKAKYFNAGVLVIDLAQWRRQEVRQRSLEYIRTYAESVYFWDQEALNAVLAGRWGELDPQWNRHPTLDHLVGRHLDPDLGRGAASPASSDHGILHFSGSRKPWNLACGGTSWGLYQSYLDRTDWAGWRPARRWQDELLTWYETSYLRRRLYPAEQLATMVLRRRTRNQPGVNPVGGERA